MATGKSGTLIFSGNQGMKIRLGWAEEYDALANTSQVRITSAELQSGTYWSYWYFSGTISVGESPVVYMSASAPTTHVANVSNAGSTWYPIQAASGSPVPWYSGTLNHNPDGTLSIPVTVSLNLYRLQPSSVQANVSGTQNIALTTIPRASSITATSGNINEAINIQINKASPSFTHTITYSFGALSGTIAAQTSDSQIVWTIPDAFYTQIPDEQSALCTLTCATYSGGTNIGSKTTTFRAYVVPEDCAPSVTGAAADTDAVTTALTGDANRIIRYASIVQATITATARKSANILETRINEVITESGTYEFINPSNSQFTFWANDSRGLAASVTVNKPLVPYIRPTINPIFYRPQPTTGEIALTFDGNIYMGAFDAAGLNTNTLTIQYRYKPSSATIWGAWATVPPAAYDISNGSYQTAEPFSLGTNFDYTLMYDFQIQAADQIYTVGIHGENKIVVSRGMPVFDWGKDDFNVNGELKINGVALQDVISGVINDMVAPVGVILQYANDLNPASKFGGTWQKIEGRFLLGSSSNYQLGSAGGEATHTLTLAESPRHTHTAKGWAAVTDGSGTYITLGGAGVSQDYSTNATGGGKPHNNMPPYKVVNIWERIA